MTKSHVYNERACSIIQASERQRMQFHILKVLLVSFSDAKNRPPWEKIRRDIYLLVLTTMGLSTSGKYVTSISIFTVSLNNTKLASMVVPNNPTLLNKLKLVVKVGSNMPKLSSGVSKNCHIASLGLEPWSLAAGTLFRGLESWDSVGDQSFFILHSHSAVTKLRSPRLVTDRGYKPHKGHWFDSRPGRYQVD